MNDKSSSSLPIVVIVIGGCALLTLFAGCIAALVLLFGGVLFAAAPVVSTSPSVVTVEVSTIAPETNQPTETNTSSSTDSATPTDTPPQTPTPQGNEPPATAVPDNGADANAETRQQIEENVVELRELPQLDEVELTSLTPDELREQLEEDFMEDYSPEEARLDVLSLSAFDLLERDFELYNFTIDLLTEQIAGFYDPETDEFVVISTDAAAFTVLEQFTYAHEFIHALQDQHFQLDLLSDDSLEADHAFAIRALAEGDATLGQTLYVSQGYFTQEQLLEILSAAGEIESTIFDSAPPVMAHELEFPYSTGLLFAQTLYAQGGYAAVDAAWENLPQSTEQIIHPDRYLSGDQPQIVSVQPLTDTLGAGWQQIDEDTLGEFYLREYLMQQLDAVTTETAATGWGGDRYTVYWNEEAQQIVMALKLVWDTPADLEEFAAAYQNYPANLFNAEAASQPDGGQCWQGADVICFYNNGEETMIVRAPNLETAASVAAAQGLR